MKTEGSRELEKLMSELGRVIGLMEEANEVVKNSEPREQLVHEIGMILLGIPGAIMNHKKALAEGKIRKGFEKEIVVSDIDFDKKPKELRIAAVEILRLLKYRAWYVRKKGAMILVVEM